MVFNNLSRQRHHFVSFTVLNKWSAINIISLKQINHPVNNYN